MRALAPLPLLLLTAACATTGPVPPPTAAGPARPGDSQASSEAELEPVYAIALGRGGLTVRVSSNGCTKKSDFETLVLDGWPAPTLILRRVKPDLCRAFVAGGAELILAYGELGLKPNGQVVLANPLTADPKPGRQASP